MWEKKHKLHSRHVGMLMRGVARGRIYADFKRLRSAVWRWCLSGGAAPDFFIYFCFNALNSSPNFFFFPFIISTDVWWSLFMKPLTALKAPLATRRLFMSVYVSRDRCECPEIRFIPVKKKKKKNTLISKSLKKWQQAVFLFFFFPPFLLPFFSHKK